MKELSTLLKPVITEKATDLQSDGKYMFFVNKTATKVDVKKAVEAIYGAKVKVVRIVNTQPKKRFTAKRRVLVKKPALKKAIITLKKGEKKIDINKIKVKA